MIFSLALRELRHAGSRLFAVLFILAVGLTGPLLAGALRSSVSQFLAERSRQMLSADLAVSATRPLRPEELTRLKDVLRPRHSVEETELVTMARGPGQAALVEVKAEEEGFPIFGVLKLKGLTTDVSSLQRERIAWVFPEVLTQLGIRVGDFIHIGHARFRIAAEVLEAPGQGRVAGFAPRLYIGRNFVAETGLTQYGSQVYHRVYVELPERMPVETAAGLVKTALPDPDIFLRTPDDAIQGFDRFFRFFGLYLGVMVALVFSLAWAGAFYILQIFLQDRLKNAAIFLVHGASRSRTSALYAFQIFTLLTVACFIASVFVVLAVQTMPSAFRDIWPEGFILRVGSGDFLSLAGLALASSFAFIAPFLVKLYGGKLQSLLGENSLGIERVSLSRVALGYVPTAIVFLALSVWLMGPVTDALKLATAVALTGIVGVLLGRALFKIAFRAVKGRPGFARLVLTALSRSRFGVNLCFLALVLVALAMNLVPHLLRSVVQEVNPLRGREIPAFFLFNIPESQLDSLKKFAREKDVELRYLSPLIQGRILALNGESIQSEQLQRFPVRISYRAQRIPSESIAAGRDFLSPREPGSPAQISVEQRFAERNGMKLGDRLSFDVQGVPIEGEIVSLRRVKWTDFNPNFFLVFEPGILDDAPKTWLANVNTESGEDAKTYLQFELIRDFPDLSVIDVGRTITRVLDIARSVIGPVTVAAWLAALMSFLILLGIIGHNLTLRAPEVDVQKILGADERLIRRLMTGEYFATSLVAWLVGALASWGIAWFVVVRIFEITLSISWVALLASGLGIVGVTTTLAWMVAGSVLKLRGASRKL